MFKEWLEALYVIGTEVTNRDRNPSGLLVSWDATPKEYSYNPAARKALDNLQW